MTEVKLFDENERLVDGIDPVCVLFKGLGSYQQAMQIEMKNFQIPTSSLMMMKSLLKIISVDVMVKLEHEGKLSECSSFQNWNSKFTVKVVEIQKHIVARIAAAVVSQ